MPVETNSRGRRFRARAEFYQKAVEESREANIIRAEIETPHGTTEPGIVILLAGRPRLTLTAEHAWRLAEELANELEYLQANHLGGK